MAAGGGRPRWGVDILPSVVSGTGGYGPDVTVGEYRGVEDGMVEEYS